MLDVAVGGAPVVDHAAQRYAEADASGAGDLRAEGWERRVLALAAGHGGRDPLRGEVGGGPLRPRKTHDFRLVA